MNTVAQLMGMALKEGDLGIEIETEAKERYKIPIIPGWINKPDGSLRNFGVEYVSDGPTSIGNLRKHLENWKTALGALHDKLDPDSISTSVHVHVNVQPLTPMQTLVYYITSVLFEDVMSRFAGPDRVGNLFCLRTKDAENHFTNLRSNISKCQDEHGLLRAFNPTGEAKIYANIHTIPITSFGTLEHRIMRGTTNIDEIEVWARTLYQIREFSKRFATPCDLLAYLKATGPRQVLAEAFGRDYGEFNYDGAEVDLVKSYFYVADLATCRKRWDIKPSEVRKTKPRVEVVLGRNGLGAPRGLAENGQVVHWDENYEEEDI